MAVKFIELVRGRRSTPGQNPHPTSTDAAAARPPGMPSSPTAGGGRRRTACGCIGRLGRQAERQAAVQYLFPGCRLATSCTPPCCCCADRQGPRFYQKYVEREIINHRLLAHPHIVGFKEVFVTQKVGPCGLCACCAGERLVGRRFLPWAWAVPLATGEPSWPPTPPLPTRIRTRSAAPGDRDGVRGRRQPAAVCGGGGAVAGVAGALLLPAAHPGVAGGGAGGRASSVGGVVLGVGASQVWWPTSLQGRSAAPIQPKADPGVLSHPTCPSHCRQPAHPGRVHQCCRSPAPALWCSTATPTCASRTATSSWATCC